jgi:DNA-binding transcriptional ArsR family regulator
MKQSAASGFRALAHELRLSIFRFLIKEGPRGLAAGKIAAHFDVPPSTLSSHLSRLEQAGLLYSWREQQKIMYAVDIEGTQSLMHFLVEDCCGGDPHLCGMTVKKSSGSQRSKLLKTG